METLSHCGPLQGNEREGCFEYLGVPFAKAKRFEYATPVTHWDGVLDATKFGKACTQVRTYFEHLDVPERLFYHREYRENLTFEYGEDCLNLNIYTPKDKGPHPVLVFVHGGGFNSGANSESPFDGAKLASRGLVVVFLQYRVGVFGYFTHEEVQKRNGRDGNFGLDDLVVGFRWIKDNIDAFGGDPNSITAMGQSAGAMSIQYICISHKCEHIFNRAIMMSGAGLFPKFSLPKPAAERRPYWLEVMEIAGCKTFEEFQALPEKQVFEALEVQCSRRKDNMMNTMPVLDGYLLHDPVDELIKHPGKIPYMIGVTNNDMYTAILMHMAKSYAKQVNGYLYYFDVDAKGDENLAFHSADLRYVFGTLKKSWRPYDETDEAASEKMMDYIANFAKTSDPNGEGLPKWEKVKPLVIRADSIKMGRIPFWRSVINTFKGDPK